MNELITLSGGRIINPITKRSIIINGSTFNKLSRTNQINVPDLIIYYKRMNRNRRYNQYPIGSRLNERKIQDKPIIIRNIQTGMIISLFLRRKFGRDINRYIYIFIGQKTCGHGDCEMTKCCYCCDKRNVIRENTHYCPKCKN